MSRAEPEMPVSNLVVTVSVEPDRPRGEVQARTSLRNLQGLSRLQRICDRFGVPPTYLVAFPVLGDKRSARLARYQTQDGAEIGALLEPWNTPPFEANEDRLVPRIAPELPASAIAQKAERLTYDIADRFGRQPTSHRAAGMGLNGALLQTLERLDYTVDSSVAPFTERVTWGIDWRDAPEAPYFPDRQAPARRGASPVLQVPLTVGWSHELMPALGRALVHAPRRLRALAQTATDHLPVPEISWFDPSQTGLKPLRQLAKTLVDRGLPCLNLSLSSSHCWPGESAANPENADVDAMFDRIEGILRYTVDELRAKPSTLSGFADVYLST